MTESTRSVSWTILLGICVSVILVGAKAAAWYLTGSFSIRASLFDSLFDIGSSSINWIAFRYSLRPADDKYRWGHGKAEALASFLQSLFIGISSIWFISDTCVRFFAPCTIENSTMGLGFMIAVSLLTLMLVSMQRYILHTTDSLILKSDNLHYENDLLSNVAILISLVLSMKFHFVYADIMLALIIFAYIVWGSLTVLVRSFAILMDKELPLDIQEHISRIVLSHDSVLRLSDLKTRSSGHKKFIQFHIDVTPASQKEEVASDIAIKVEQAIEGSDVTVCYKKNKN